MANFQMTKTRAMTRNFGLWDLFVLGHPSFVIFLLLWQVR